MAANSNNPDGYRSSFESIVRLLNDPKADRKSLKDFPLREVIMFIGWLQTRCIAYGPPGPDGKASFSVAEETFLRITKDDVRFLWAAEQYLQQHEIMRVTDEERQAHKKKR